MKAPPTNKERWKLLGSLQKQVNKVHGKDDEGDGYAVVDVHDRRDGHWPYIRPVPRVPWDNPTPEQMLAAVDAAGNNVESTARDFDQVRRDVQMYFEKDKRGHAIRAAARKILGIGICIGQSYSRYDDAPPWGRWVPYKVKRVHGGVVSLENCYYNDVNQFDTDDFKKWLEDGKRVLKKLHGKQIKGWYLRTDGSCGMSLAALVETPEDQRPFHVARNRAKREFLERYANDIEIVAKRIEEELRAKKA